MRGICRLWTVGPCSVISLQVSTQFCFSMIAGIKLRVKPCRVGGRKVVPHNLASWYPRCAPAMEEVLRSSQFRQSGVVSPPHQTGGIMVVHWRGRVETHQPPAGMLRNGYPAETAMPMDGDGVRGSREPLGFGPSFCSQQINVQ
jgi:hypothetical protein